MEGARWFNYSFSQWGESVGDSAAIIKRTVAVSRRVQPIMQFISLIADLSNISSAPLMKANVDVEQNLEICTTKGRLGD